MRTFFFSLEQGLCVIRFALFENEKGIVNDHLSSCKHRRKTKKGEEIGAVKTE